MFLKNLKRWIIKFRKRIPSFKNWIPKRDIEKGYVDEWLQMFKEIQMEEVMS